ncbi:MAG: cation:proton antiporter, partial [Leptolyngbyaceae cyanobacterium SL_5_9]|nr:cation:proton antiporter [Leptolyngbyaceae cyanobacterium SL_5_9]
SKANVGTGFWAAVILLIGGLAVANVVYYEAYTVANIVKPLAITALGWLAYLLVFRQTAVKLPRLLEQFDHLIGVMSLMLVLLFWMVMA